jgi:hypothetical protein
MGRSDWLVKARRSYSSAATDSGNGRPILGHGNGFVKPHTHDGVVGRATRNAGVESSVHGESAGRSALWNMGGARISRAAIRGQAVSRVTSGGAVACGSATRIPGAPGRKRRTLLMAPAV